MHTFATLTVGEAQSRPSEDIQNLSAMSSDTLTYGATQTVIPIRLEIRNLTMPGLSPECSTEPAAVVRMSNRALTALNVANVGERESLEEL
jgi:hypothetical protein